MERGKEAAYGYSLSQKLKDYDKDNIDPKQYGSSTSISRTPTLKFQSKKCHKPSCRSHCGFARLQYNVVSENSPKACKFLAAVEELGVRNEDLREKQKQAEEAEANVKKLKVQYNEAVFKKEALEAKAELTEKQLSHFK